MDVIDKAVAEVVWRLKQQRTWFALRVRMMALARLLEYAQADYNRVSATAYDAVKRESDDVCEALTVYVDDICIDSQVKGARAFLEWIDDQIEQEGDDAGER